MKKLLAVLLVLGLLLGAATVFVGHAVHTTSEQPTIGHHSYQLFDDDDGGDNSCCGTGAGGGLQ